MADLFQIPYVETSALSGFNVDLLFRKVAKDVFVEYLEGLRSSGDSGVSKEDKLNKEILTLKKEQTRTPNKRYICKCGWRHETVDQFA